MEFESGRFRQVMGRFAINPFSGERVPIWVAKPSLFPTFGLTGSVENVDFGFKPSPATITIATGAPSLLYAAS